VILAVLGCGALVVTPHTPRPGVNARLSAESAARAFQLGIEAATLGLPLSACPFSGEDAARAWRAGWRWWSGGV
jgi:ribosome modulation factor